MGEVDLPLLLVELVHRKVDDPAEAERALFEEVELLGDPRSSETRELGSILFLTGGEENAIVGSKSHRLCYLVHALFAVVLGDWAAPITALARRIAEASEALAPRPLIHVVEEFAALFGRSRRRDSRTRAPFSTRPAKIQARALELLRDIGDQQRIAQIRLVTSVF